MEITFTRKTRKHISGRPVRFIKRGHVWSVNTPVVFGRMRWGWSQPGQAPGTAGGHHTQTACLTGAWPGLERGTPLGPG